METSLLARTLRSKFHMSAKAGVYPSVSITHAQPTNARPGGKGTASRCAGLQIYRQPISKKELRDTIIDGVRVGDEFVWAGRYRLRFLPPAGGKSEKDRYACSRIVVPEGLQERGVRISRRGSF